MTLTRPTTREYFRIRRDNGVWQTDRIWHTVVKGSMGPLCGRDMSSVLAVGVFAELPQPMCRRCLRRLAFMELEESQYYELYDGVGFKTNHNVKTFQQYH